MATKNKINKDVKQAETQLRTALSNAFKQGFEHHADLMSRSITPQLAAIEAQFEQLKSDIAYMQNKNNVEVTVEKEGEESEDHKEESEDHKEDTDSEVAE